MKAALTVRLASDVALAAVGLAASGSAFAAAPQTQTQTEAPAPASPTATAPDATNADQNGIGDIIVTATRRDEKLQSVPISITAIGGDQLARTGVHNTLELTQQAPNLIVSRANAAIQPVVRGVGTKSSGPGDESNVAVYVDGVYQPDPASQLLDLGNSIQRVEVLRGPQGTLFGRNATGGLLNIITKAPSHKGQLVAELRYGNYNERSAEVYTTLGVTNTVAVNFSGLVLQDDGYLTDIVRNRRVAPRSEYVARGKILFEPTSNFHLTVTGSYSYLDDAAQLSNQPFQGNTNARAIVRNPFTIIPTAPYTVATTLPSVLNTESSSISANAVLELGGVNIENTFGYQRTVLNENVDSDNTAYDNGHTIVDNGIKSRYYSNETRLISTGSGPFSYVAGVFLIAGHGEFTDGFITFLPNNVPSANVKDDQRTRSAAGFAEGTLKLGSHLKVIGGVRYTSETRKFVGSTFSFTSNATLTAVDTRSTFKKFTYRGIIQYEVPGLGNVYGSVSRGFKSGVYNSYSTSPTSASTRPEVLDAYEVGVKLDPLPWLRLNVSAFHYDYKDIQLNARDPNNNQLVILQNAASARMNGVEAELTIRPTHNFNINGFATYLDAKYNSFPGAQIYAPIYQNQTAIGLGAAVPIGNAASIADESGRQVIRSPKTTFGVTADYSFETNAGQFGITGNVYHTASYFWDFSNRLTQPGYTLVNGELSWTLPHSPLRLSVWGKNLTDTVYYQYMAPSTAGDLIAFARPRTYGVAVKISL